MFEFIARLTESRRRRKQLWYAPVLGLAMALMMARLLWLANWLAVDDFAAVAFGLLVSSGFCVFGALGLHPLLQRDLPGMLIRGEEEKAQCLLMQACVAASVCFLLLIPVTVLGPSLSVYPLEIWVAGSLHGLAQQLFLIATTDSRSRGNTLQFAFDNLYRAVITVGVSWPLLLVSGSAVHVLMLEAAISLTLCAFVLRRAFIRRTKGLIVLVYEAVSKVATLPWRNALFLLSASTLAYCLLTVDRWVASWLLSKQDFAQYAFIGIGIMIAQSLQNLLNAAVFPMIARRAATQGNASAFRIARNLSLVSLALGSIIGPIIVFIAQRQIGGWLPQYLSALPLAWPLCLVAVLRLSDFYSTFLVVSGQERALTYTNLLILLSSCIAVLTMTWRPSSMDIEPIHFVVALAVGVGVTHYLAVAAIAWHLKNSRHFIS